MISSIRNKIYKQLSSTQRNYASKNTRQVNLTEKEKIIIPGIDLAKLSSHRHYRFFSSIHVYNESDLLFKKKYHKANGTIRDFSSKFSDDDDEIYVSRFPGGKKPLTAFQHHHDHDHGHDHDHDHHNKNTSNNDSNNDEDEMEDMFVEPHASLGHDLLEWGGPTRGGRYSEPTRFGDWERKGRCTDF